VIVTKAPNVEGFAEELSDVVVDTADAVPVRLMLWVEPATFSESLVRTVEPLTDPATVGSKSMATVQLPPAPSVAAELEVVSWGQEEAAS